MAILYDWYENPGESDDSEEKGLHPRIFLNGKVGTDKLCRMIHERSSLSVGDVKMRSEMLAQICMVKNCARDVRCILRDLAILLQSCGVHKK